MKFFSYKQRNKIGVEEKRRRIFIHLKINTNLFYLSIHRALGQVQEQPNMSYGKTKKQTKITFISVTIMTHIIMTLYRNANSKYVGRGRERKDDLFSFKYSILYHGVILYILVDGDLLNSVLLII